MEQLVLDIPSAEDAALIKQLMKHFKGVEVNSFSSTTSINEVQSRIEQGLEDINEGRTKPWQEVKENLLRKIKPQ